QQEGGDHAEPGCDQDQQRDDAELRPVGAKQPPDPAQVRLAHRFVGGTHRLFTRREPAVTASWHTSTVACPARAETLPALRLAGAAEDGALGLGEDPKGPKLAARRYSARSGGVEVRS